MQYIWALGRPQVILWDLPRLQNSAHRFGKRQLEVYVQQAGKDKSLLKKI